MSAILPARDPLAGELDVFVRPASLAVVGASADPAKWGYWLTLGALKGSHRRPVYLVNRNGQEIAGVATFKDLKELPEVPELVAITVPGETVLPVIKDALAMGVKAFLVISARVKDEEKIRDLLREHDARLIGPNSLGIFSAEGDLQLMWGEMRPGSLAIVSQSGQLGSEIAALGAKAGVGISRFVSLGNQLDVNAADMLESLEEDVFTKTVGIYLEDLSRGTKIFEAVKKLRQAGKAVVFLTTGASEASRDLALTHTGAMTTETELIDAACHASGGVRVNTPFELVQIASLSDKGAVPSGKRVAIISDSGGQGGIAADAAWRHGLEVPGLSEKLRQELAALLPEGASTRNPIDLAGAGEKDLTTYSKLPEILAESGEVDAVILSGYFGSYGQDTPSLMEEEREVASALMQITQTPVLVHAMAHDSMVSLELALAGVPVADRIEDLMLALSGAINAFSPPREIETAETEKRMAMPQGPVEAREALAELGVQFAEARVVETAAQARAAASELGGVLVLKAAWLAHKTEHGGVQLGITSADEAVSAWQEMHDRLGDGKYTLERQDTRVDVAEYIVSARREAAFGTVITVGFGGTETELWQDISVAIGPVDETKALEMLSTLKSWPLLGEWRGRAPLDSVALAKIIALLSQIVAASPEITEIELNPIRVGIHEAIAVDCLVR